MEKYFKNVGFLLLSIKICVKSNGLFKRKFDFLAIPMETPKLTAFTLSYSPSVTIVRKKKQKQKQKKNIFLETVQPILPKLFSLIVNAQSLIQ